MMFIASRRKVDEVIEALKALGKELEGSEPMAQDVYAEEIFKVFVQEVVRTQRKGRYKYEAE